MNAQAVVNLIAKGDGAVAAGALAVAKFDPSLTKGALLASGIAGGIGVLVTVVARFLGLSAPPPPPTTAAAKS